MRRLRISCTAIIILVLAAFSEAAQDSQAQNIAELFMRVNPKLQAKTANNYAEIILQACEKFKLDPYVIAAIIVHESTVNNKAVSKGGDYGLMQVRYKVHERAIKQRFPNVKRASDMFDAKTNIFFGCEIFSDCYKKSKNLYDALKRYSGGSEKLANKVTATIRELQAKDKTQTRKGK